MCEFMLRLCARDCLLIVLNVNCYASEHNIELGIVGTDNSQGIDCEAVICMSLDA